ncbi:hypothetical protein ACJJWD_08380 [Comamonas testosteroni]
MYIRSGFHEMQPQVSSNDGHQRSPLCQPELAAAVQTRALLAELPFETNGLSRDVMSCLLGYLAIVVNDFKNPENNGALLKVMAHCAIAIARIRLSIGPGTPPNDMSPLHNGDSKM